MNDAALKALAFNGIPLALWVWLIHMAVFHGVGYGFHRIDESGALKGYKVRDAEPLSYAAMLPRVLLNQTCILLPVMLALQFAGLAFVGSPRLGVLGFVGGLAAMAIGHDIVQYAGHRWLLHDRRFRWLGHDIHHRTGASKSITACYMSAPDFFLNIVAPYLVPLVLIGGGGADLRFHAVAAGLGTIGGLYEHSGYDFAPKANATGGSFLARIWRSVPPTFVSSHAHGEHHRRWHVSFSDGFGSPGLCDLLFGTRWDRS